MKLLPSILNILPFCISLSTSSLSARATALKNRAAESASCTPFSTTFSSASDVSSSSSGDSDAPFLAISPRDTYDVATSDGLRLNLLRPGENVQREGDVNNLLGMGATVNSTFMFRYGVATFQIQAPSVAGAIVAGILTAESGDEIDIELVCGDPSHWQTNVFAPKRTDQGPLFGVFGDIEDFSHRSDSLTSLHNYTVDWTAERIVWSVDGRAVRTLKPSQTVLNGTEHYPTAMMRMSLGIWDASSPVGTSNWGKGPINWNAAPSKISASIRGIWLECHK